MHIYTRHGDDGHTVLLGGQRVWKDDIRTRVGGGIDEVNSWLGVIAAHAPQQRPELAAQMRQLAGELFTLGAIVQLEGDLARHPELRPAGIRECRRIELWIDAVEADLPPAEGFIIPGGCAAASFAHVARCVCRRTECDLVALARHVDGVAAAVLADAVAYLNRLADFLFVVARFCNQLNNVVDYPVAGDAS